jgi:hypothetical protein
MDCKAKLQVLVEDDVEFVYDSSCDEDDDEQYKEEEP